MQRNGCNMDKCNCKCVYVHAILNSCMGAVGLFEIIGVSLNISTEV